MGFVERDAYAVAVLVARMADASLEPAPIFDDLESLPSELYCGKVDWISAGFPCQPFSSAGKKLGLDDERWLWPRIRDIIASVEPEFVFLENVPGIVKLGLPEILQDLADLGFDAEWDVYSAAGIGAPHLRRRFYLVARRVPDADGQRVRLLSERGEGVPQAADERHAEPVDLGAGMADPNRARWSATGGRHEEHARRQSLARGDEMADAEGLGRGPWPQRATGEPGGREPGTTARREEVGDANSRRREGERVPQHAEQLGPSGNEPDRSDFYRRFPWPPGPEDAAG